MPPAVTIRSLPRAFEFVKAMHGEGVDWGEGHRGLGRDAIAAILQGQMAQAVNEHLDRTALLDEADRRNGSYRRHLLTELGEIELAVPRTRRFAPIGVVRAPSRAGRPDDPGVLFPRAVGAQGERGPAADPRAADQPRHREHRGQAARCGGGRLSCAAVRGTLASTICRITDPTQAASGVDPLPWSPSSF
jgi:hypothetical protein